MRVHDLVETAASDAPSPRYTVDDIVAAGRRVQRRRRVGWTVAGAAFAVAGVVAATSIGLPRVAARPDGGDRPAAVTSVATASPSSPVAGWEFPDDPFSYVFHGFAAGKLHVQDPIVASTAYQIAAVYADGLVTRDRAMDPADISGPSTDRNGEPRLFAYLTVYRPGAFDAERFTGERVTLDGHRAIEQQGPRYGSNLHRALAWEYTDDGWAVADSFADPSDITAADLRGLLAGLQAQRTPVPARVPFTVGYLPAGYHAVELGQHAFAGLNGIAMARNGDYGSAIYAAPALPVTGLTEPYGGADGEDPPGSFEIFVLPNANSNQALRDGAQPPAEPTCGHGFCNAWTADGKTSIQVDSGGRLSNAEMTKILNGVRLADVTDDSTWPRAATALRAG